MIDKSPPPPTTPLWRARLLVDGKCTDLSPESLAKVWLDQLAASIRGRQ